MAGVCGEGSEGVVYKGTWRMMPVVAKVFCFVCVLFLRTHVVYKDYLASDAG